MDEAQLMLEKAQNRRIEMVWFGGINQEFSSCVFHVTLRLDFSDDYGEDVQTGSLLVKKLRNSSGKLVNLKKPDRFFYN